MAKIENRRGLDKLDEIMAAADIVCIARGDLGNAMPLWELPSVQKEIARRCRQAGRPMAVLTSCIPELCRAALTRHRILDWFQGTVYAQETGLE